MHVLARSLPQPGHVGLQAGWAMAQGDGPEPPADPAAWRALAGPLPVAAALAADGQALLDATSPPDLDQQTWWYRCRFDRPGPAGPWWLGLDGLATLASVWLNGEPLLDSRNMFRAQVLALGPETLRAQDNQLLIRFDPLAAALAQRRPRPRWRVPMLANQQLRWFRTTLLGRTPGWSPSVPVVGPWRPVWLAPQHPAHVVHLTLDAQLDGDQGRLAVAVAWADDAGLDQVQALVQRQGAPAGEAVAGAALVRGPDRVWRGTVLLPQVKRWWPHTHGEPQLYEVRLQMGGTAAWPEALPAGRVGFRSLAVERSGGGFQLRVNDVPVFLRGACWTPQDSLRLHAEPAQTSALLQRLRAAGLNMLRIGGTMAYESEAFLDACDAQGILLWQELMFASMDYPGDDPQFLAEVEAEVRQQAAAWQGRPALAVVCGNSEVAQQAAMWGAARADWTPPLFHERMPAWLAETLPGTPYWPSSAHGGALPFQPSEGTCSYYGVGAYRRPPDDARHSRLRLATECLAFANVPDDTTLARLRDLNEGRELRVHSALWKARSPRDLGAGWDFDDVRDHYLEQLYGERAEALRAHDPARHLMLSRAAVAELMRQCFDQWRSADACCSGALVWFLRDLRAGAGWGVLDDSTAPKSAFHGLASAWQPRHLGLVDDGLNGVTVHLVNETPQPVDGELQLTWLQAGRTPVAQARQAVSLPARGQAAWPAQALLDSFVDSTWAYRFGPPVADVLWARWQDAQGQPVAERLLFLPGEPRLQRHDLGLQADARVLDDHSRELTVQTAVAARAVHLVAEGWRADDDYFDLAPGVERRIRVRPLAAARPPAWRVMLQAINGLQPVLVRGGA